MTYRMRRWGLIGLVVLPAALLLGDFLAWRMAEQQLQQGLSAWLDTQRAHGWTITTGAMRQGGWPFAATLAVSDMVVAGGDAQLPGGITWRTNQLTLRVAPPQLRRIVMLADGQQSLRLGHFPDVAFTAERLEATLPLAGDAALSSADIVATQLRIDLPAGAGGGALTAGTIRLQLEGQPSPASAITYTLQAEAIDMPPGPRWPLGPQIAALAVNGALSGPFSRGDTLALRLAAWRDGGGTLQIESLAVRWGSLDLRAKATLTLDEQLQPMGAATTRITGQARALDVMASEGVIKQQVAVAAKAILALMSRPAAAGEAAAAEVPLTLQNRTLAMGRIPLVRLPELEWGAR